MRICMLVEATPPALTGAALQSFKLAASLRTLGIESFFVGSRWVKDVPSEDVHEGFRVYRVPFSTDGKWNKLRGLLGVCRLLTRHRHEFDVLHLHACHYLTLAMAFYVRYVLRKPFLIKLTSINFDTPSGVKRRKYGSLAWFLYRQADSYVCMSSAQLEECRAHGLPESKLHKIPNGVDTQKYRPIESDAERVQSLTRLGLSPSDRHVVFIGHIQKAKGVDLLVDIAAAVCARRTDVKFLLIGPDGSQPGEHYIDREFVAETRDRIVAAKLQDRVQILGRRTNTDEYLRAASLFLFTSRMEGFGTVVIEGMACGLPCVALKIPQVTTDMITSGQDGIVIEREDPTEFATAILNLMENPDRARELGAAARTTAVETFDLAVIAKRYAEVYEALTGKK